MQFIITLVIIYIVYLVIKSSIKKFLKINVISKNNTKFYQKESIYLVRLFAKMATSDGKVEKIEDEFTLLLIDRICEELQSEYMKRELRRAYELEKISNNKAYSIALEYSKYINLKEKVDIIFLLLNMAYVDGNFSLNEENTLREIGDAFGINKSAMDDILYKFEQTINLNKPQQKNPYEVLGLQSNASFEDIKKRWRKLSREYHPDLLTGKGADENKLKEATEKLQEINRAYEELKKRFDKS